MLLCILRNQWTAVADNPRLSIEVANPTPPPRFLQRIFTIHKNGQNNP